jgi:dipeptidyl aminopeptidase/acylaminoacyl peptidase
MDTVFRCAIVHAGVSDVVSLCCAKDSFARFCDQLLARFSDEDRRREVERRSALYFADKLPRTTPILLLHGDQDKVIPAEQTEAFAVKLADLGIPHEHHVIEGGGHVALKDGSYREIDRLRRDWLERYLAPS